MSDTGIDRLPGGALSRADKRTPRSRMMVKTNIGPLELAQIEVSDLLDKIKRAFKPGVKLTLMVRTPTSRPRLHMTDDIIKKLSPPYPPQASGAAATKWALAAPANPHKNREARQMASGPRVIADASDLDASNRYCTCCEEEAHAQIRLA